MIKNRDFILDFINRYNYSEEAKADFISLYDKISENKNLSEEIQAIIIEYLFPTPNDIRLALGKLKLIAEKENINEYTLYFVFILMCLPEIYARYNNMGIAEAIFYETFDDLRCKNNECFECKGVNGTFVAHWYDGFFKLKRFAYGRFQFEAEEYSHDFPFVTKGGKIIQKGDKVINFHIPSSGVPLSDEVRMASYKKAYEKYKHLFDDGKVIFRCDSWLLFPKHRNFLPKNSNIIKFSDDFEIVSWKEKEQFGDCWRIFGKYADLPIDKLPQNTSLRKAYALWLADGNKSGSGEGIFVFDGKKIIK